QVIGRNARAVVAHAQQLDAALLHIHVDAPRAGIQAILQQLLGDRRRALDHLAGGDLVGQPRAEQLDATQVTHGCTARLVPGMRRDWPMRIMSLSRLLAWRRLARVTW